MIEPIGHSVTSIDQLWDTPPNLSITDSKDAISELASYGWRVYPSTHVDHVERLATRFMAHHVVTPSVLTDTLAVSMPLAIGQYSHSHHQVTHIHKFALYHNGLVWQARTSNGEIVYTVLAVEPATAEQWSYPATYFDLTALIAAIRHAASSKDT